MFKESDCKKDGKIGIKERRVNLFFFFLRRQRESVGEIKTIQKIKGRMMEKEVKSINFLIVSKVN